MARDIEELTRIIGRRLFRGVRERRPHPLSRAWLDDLAMTAALGDDRAKAQLFRFVDALPGLADAGEITRHLLEYLVPVRERLPAAVRAALGLVRERGPSAWLAAAAARTGARLLARKFIAGSDLDEVVATIARLRGDSLAFTIDVLGEAVISDREAGAYQSLYLTLIDALADAARSWPAVDLADRDHLGALPRVNVSVKLSALVARFDPADPLGTARAVRDRLRPLLRRARRRGVFVNVDMEQYAFKDLTLRIVQDILGEAEFRSWPDVGVAVQAYLRDSAGDLERLARWAERRGAPLWVRLVKGAYHDYERVVAAQNGWPVPVFTDKAATDANFEALTGLLIERRDVLRPAIAGHNVRSIAHALALAQRARVPAGCLEFQMLYGMADQLKAALVDLGQRVRVYTPFGRLLPGMAYLVRRLLENTSNQSFVRAGFLEHRDELELLMRPSPATPSGEARGAPTGFVNQAPSDFSTEAPRAALAAALAALHAELAAGPRRCPLVIDGREVATERVIESRNPSRTSQAVARSACASARDAELAVAAARAAFPAWRDLPAERRSALLERTAEVLVRKRFELVALIILESGKNAGEADADVAEAVDFCRYYAAEMRRLATPRRRDVPGEENRYCYEGRGVAVVLAPWNFPLAILCGMTTAALAGGNTVIMKPAEQTPGIAAALMSAFREAGMPAGVVNHLPGIGEEIGPLLVGHRDVSLVAFTGSQTVGLEINRAAAAVAAGADEVKRVVCEMGGKNAIIIDQDADLDEAVLGVMHSAFGYQGQKCSACSRAIVLAPIHDVFLERLIAATRSLAVGPAEDPSAAFGPVIDGEARDRIIARIAEARASGARLAYAGACGDAGWYVAPHIFAEVRPDSRLAQEEIFGPVLAVLKADDLGQALAIANGTRYALTGGIYSRSPAAIERAKREFRVGNLYINRRITGALVDRQPFGGLRMSGIGTKAGGPDYLLQFMVPRCITENTLRHGFTPEVS